MARAVQTPVAGVMTKIDEDDGAFAEAAPGDQIHFDYDPVTGAYPQNTEWDVLDADETAITVVRRKDGTNG